MERLGRYEILGELGRGGMGVVYRAKDPIIGRVVAVKTIRFLDQNPDVANLLRQRFVREAQAAGTLAHPHIVSVYDFGQEGETMYVVMEFIEGRSLESVLASPRDASILPKLMQVLLTTANALDFAHKKGVIHRDVKPANILVQADGSAKLSDFGIAKTTTATTMTQPGSALGTLQYIAPEQLKGTELTGNADQFSLAVVAYEILTGRSLYDTFDLWPLCNQILNETPPLASSRNPALPPAVDRVLAKGLAKLPADRFASCTELIRAVDSAMRPEPAPLASVSVPERIPESAPESISPAPGVDPKDAMRFVEFAYAGLLGRSPGHTEAGQGERSLTSAVKPAEYVSTLWESVEFRDGSAFVAALYWWILGRDPDYAGWLHFRNILVRGREQGEKSDAQKAWLAENFLNSNEFRSKHPAPLRLSSMLIENTVRCTLAASMRQESESNKQSRLEFELRSPAILNLSETSRQTANTTSVGAGTMVAAVLAQPAFTEMVKPRRDAFLLHATLLRRSPTQEELDRVSRQLNSKAALIRNAEALLASSECPAGRPEAARPDSAPGDQALHLIGKIGRFFFGS